MTGHLPHQVEIRLDKVSAAERLHRIEAWCRDWQIGFRVLDTMTAGIVRIAFEEARFARAFVGHFGGVIVPVDGLEIALGAGAEAEDAFH